MSEKTYTVNIEIYQLETNDKWIVKLNPPTPVQRFGEFDNEHEFNTYEEAKKKFNFYLDIAKECGLQPPKDSKC